MKESTTTIAQLMSRYAEHEIPTITGTLADMAQEGNTQAAKLLFDCLVPKLKQQHEKIELPYHENLVDQAREIFKAICDKRLAPDIGIQLIGGLAIKAKIIETEELAKRIEALENR